MRRRSPEIVNPKTSEDQVAKAAKKQGREFAKAAKLSADDDQRGFPEFRTLPRTNTSIDRYLAGLD